MGLISITDVRGIASLPASPGVYWLVALDTSLQSPQPIPRLTGDDPAGVLYIGNTRRRTLRERVGHDLVRGLIGLGELPEWSRIEHPAANEYWMCAEVRYRFPPSVLAIMALPTLDQDAAELGEINFLANYRNRFGEYPPFSLTGHLMQITLHLNGH